MNLTDLQKNPAAFRAALLIDSDKGPMPLAQVMDDWQERDYLALDDGWKRAAIGAKQPAQYQRAWLERPRGHSKTSDLAVMVAWVLFASRRRLSGVAAAADEDQAQLLRAAVGRLVFLNPWLSSILEVRARSIINAHTESVMEVITSDAPTSFGLLVDFIICDELVHWKRRDLWDSLLSSAAKKASCMLTIITNAGCVQSWQHETREAVRADPSWYFSRLDAPCATWITPDRLAEQSRLLPGVSYRRLWLNEWVSAGGDALTEEDIDAAFVAGMRPQDHAAPDFMYCGGLDLGVSRDASALVILGIYKGRTDFGKIRLAAVRTWKPVKGSKVDLGEVERTIIEMNQRFALKSLAYDPWQAEHMSQRLSAGGLAVPQRLLPVSHKEVIQPSRVKMVPVPPTGNNLQAIATAVIQGFTDRRLELFEDANLRRDLNRLMVVEKSYGFRLESPSDEHGHGDTATAFSLAMLAVSELAGRRHTQLIAVNGMSHTGMSPLECQLAKLDELRLFDRMDEALAHQEGHNDPFKKFLQRVGRL